MNINKRIIALILFIVILVLSIAFTREITEATGRVYIIGKDNGITRRFELILVSSTLYFILFSNKRWWWRPLLGFGVGIVSAILGYITSWMIWLEGANGLRLFHTISCMYFMAALYFFNKRTNYKLYSQQ